MGKHKRKFSFQSTDMIRYVWSKRKVLLIVSFIVAIVSIIVSLSIRPKFRSTVILFPASSASVSKTLLSENSGQNDLLQFGTEEEGEQLLQVLHSTAIRERIIQKFNLARHYDVDTTEPFWKTRLYEEFRGNIRFHRTEFMSIVIDVLDYSPDTAALIANEISNQVDSVMTRVQRERAIKALAIVENEYNRLVGQINLMEDSLKKLRQLGIFHYDNQSEALNRAYAAAIAQGNSRGANQLETKMKILAKYGGAYETLSQLIEVETQRLSALSGKFAQSKVDAERNIPHKFVVDQAYPSEKKAYPKRSIIVLVSTLSAFFMTIMFLILRDSIAPKVKD